MERLKTLLVNFQNLELLLTFQFKPFTPQHQYAYSPYCSLHISLVLTRRNCLTIKNHFEERCFLSCHEGGAEKQFWLPMRNLLRSSLFFFFISLPSSKLTISLISIYKCYTINIADPRSMQDACHMNFVIDLAHCGVSMAKW